MRPLKHFPTIRNPSPPGCPWRTEVQIREPALAASVAPFGAEHDEIVGPHRLHLAPGLAAAPGRIGRGRVLHDDPLLTGRERLLAGRAAPSSGIGTEHRRDLELWRDAASRPARSSSGASSRSSPSRWSRSKRKVAIPSGGLAVDPAYGLRKAAGPSRVIHSASPSRTAWLRQAARQRRRSREAAVISLRLRV